MKETLFFDIKAADYLNIKRCLDKVAISEVEGLVTLQLSGLEEPGLKTFAAGFRQKLLFQVPGCAVTRLRIEYKNMNPDGESPFIPVLHKYAYIPGVVENVREIVGNLGRGIFRLPDNVATLALGCEFSKDTPVSYHCKEFLLGEFFEDDEADVILNPEQKLFTLQDRGHHIVMNITIKKGLGFKSNEASKRDEFAETQGSPDVFTMTLGADFNPVRKVGYEVKPGAINFIIETNGAVSPAEACQHVLTLLKRDVVRDEELK